MKISTKGGPVFLFTLSGEAVCQPHQLRHQGRIKGEGQRGQLPRAPRCKGDPRDKMYLFQIKYSFEKFRNSEAIQEYNSILYS